MKNLSVVVQRRIAQQLPGVVQDTGEPLLRGIAGDAGGNGNGPGVDHGVGGPLGAARLQADDGVEGIAGGLHAHPLKGPVIAAQAQRQRQKHHLGDTLHGEAHLAASHGVDVSCKIGDRDGQMEGVCPGKLRNVAGRPALSQAAGGVLIRFL